MTPSPVEDTAIITRYPPATMGDYFALWTVKTLRFIADNFFKKRYGHRAVMLETVAGVPGMIGGMLQHLKSLRTCKDDNGWIKELLEEAENERMHLMVFIEIAQPNLFERLLIIVTQFFFFAYYLVFYVVSSRTAHRFVGYLEEEAVISYTAYLKEIENGQIENIKAPEIAITYWSLSKNATLKDLIIAVRKDEAKHRDVNHALSHRLAKKN